MRQLFSKSLLFATAGGLALVAHSQGPEAPPPAVPEPQVEAPSVEAPAVEVSEAQLDAFTTIYGNLEELNARFQEEMAGIETEEEAVELQSRMREESVATIEEEGLTLDEYNEIAQAINSQPELLERAVEMLSTKQESG